MTDLILTTLDWVPDFPRGFVRDLRIRWALEEADLPYEVATTPVGDPKARLPYQPFGQVPWLTDGDVTIITVIRVADRILRQECLDQPAMAPIGPCRWRRPRA